MLVVGALLALAGVVGVVRTNALMDGVEHSQQTLGAGVHASLLGRLVPGVIANPGKYLSAVNSGGSSIAAGADPLEAVAMQSLKQAMDRYEALVGLGIALLIWGSARPVLRQQSSTGAVESSVASDAAPFIVVVALLCASMSFFELP
jgi:hypothetical protein